MKTLQEMTINERVRYFRKHRRFSQTEMAQWLGTKCSSYSQMERKGIITCERLIEISKILDVDINILLFGKVEDTSAQNRDVIELEKYRERYSFLENTSKPELNLIKAICYLSKSKRYEIYDIALKMHKKQPKIKQES